jgi:hypothetical protein
MLPLTAKDKLQGVERVLQKHPIIVILVNPFIDSTLPLSIKNRLALVRVNTKAGVITVLMD